MPERTAKVDLARGLPGRARDLSAAGLRPILCLLLLAGLSCPPAARAAHLPLWEVGAGIGAISTRSYRGSDKEVNLALPIPYIVYRGDFLEVDQEDGVRGKLFESTRLNLDLSLAGSLPVRETDDTSREGMDRLDPLVEAGVELEMNFWRSAGRTQKFSLVLPLRMAFSIGDPLIDYQGWTFSPYLNYRIFDWQEGSENLTRYSFSFGPLYADRRFHDYFYSVDPEFVTPEREAYRADGGYSGSRVTFSISHYRKRYFIGAFVRYDNLDDAVFADSPLVDTTDYYAVGIALSWIFYNSDKKVPHR